MTLYKIISIINKSKPTWYRVNNQPCIHTIVGDFNINLCKWRDDGKTVISIDVDNLNTNQSDIIHNTFSESSEEYKLLLPVYKNALNNSTIPAILV